MKIIRQVSFILFLVIFFKTDCFAQTTYQVLHGGDPTTNLSTSASSYFCLSGGVITLTAANRQQVIPTDGTLSDLFVNLSTTPGSGNDYTVTVYLNGSPSDLSVTVNDSETQDSNTSDTADVSAGDIVYVAVTPTSSPTAAKMSFSCLFSPDTAGETIMMGRSTSQFSGTNYHSFVGDSWDNNLVNHGKIIFPTDGTLKKLYAQVSPAPGAGNSDNFTVYQNDGAIDLTLTISGTDTTGSNTSDTVDISAGDTIYLYTTETGSTTSAEFSVVFLPDNSGEFILPKCSGESECRVAEGDNYFAVDSANGFSGQIPAKSATESPVQQITNAFTAKAIYVRTPIAPGAGYSYVYTLRESGASSALTVTQSDTETNDSAATDEEIDDWDLLATHVDVDTGAYLDEPMISYLGYIAPTGGGSTHRMGAMNNGVSTGIGTGVR